jgi:hypothetical protein
MLGLLLDGLLYLRLRLDRGLHHRLGAGAAARQNEGAENEQGRTQSVSGGRKISGNLEMHGICPAGFAVRKA